MNNNEIRFNLRIPKDVHNLVNRAAGQDRRSLNTWIILTIERAAKEQLGK